MQEYPTIIFGLASLVICLLAGGILMFGYWGFWHAPRAIRAAILSRHTPLQISKEVWPGLWTWILTGFLSLGEGAGVTYLSWTLVSRWREFEEGFKNEFAHSLSETYLTNAMTFFDPEVGFERFVPPVVVLLGVVGLLIGGIYGAGLGTKFAARKFRITAKSF
jgi:hypothetical protein